MQRKAGIALFILCCVWQAATAQSAAVFAAEDARFAAQVQRDTVALALLLTDSLTYIHSNALVENKAAFISSVGSGRITYESMRPEYRTVEVYRRRALVAGVVAVQGLYQGQPFAMQLHYTAYYYKMRRGGWMLHRWQSTRKG